MYPLYSTGNQSINEYDPFQVTSATPTLQPNLELPGGVKAFGMYLRRTGGHGVVEEISVPAFEESVLAIQLRCRFSYCVTFDRAYHATAIPGDIALTPRGTPVRWRVINGEMNSLVLALPQELLIRSLERDLNASSCSVELTMQVHQHDSLLHNIGLAMFSLLHTEYALDFFYLESLITLLVVHVLRTHSVSVPKPLRAEACLPAATLQRVTDYIEAHLDRGLSLESIAAICQYSPFHMARLFKTSTGYTLHQYVVDRRLTKATELIQCSALSLQEIAQQVGFADQSHLTHQFRRKYGYPPGRLRKGLGTE